MFPLRGALGTGCSETCRSGQTNNGMTTATVTAATRCGAPNVFRLVVVADNPLAHSPLHLLPRLQGLFFSLSSLSGHHQLRRRAQRRRRRGTPHQPRARPHRHRRTLAAEMVNHPRSVLLSRSHTPCPLYLVLIDCRRGQGGHCRPGGRDTCRYPG